MTSKQKNIIIILAIIALVAAVIWWTNWQRQKNIVREPDITKIYTSADFPDVQMDEAAKQDIIDKLNIDYKYLRDRVDYSFYDIWVDIGNRKLALKDFAGAVEAWEYAIFLDDRSNLAYANLANYYKSFARDYEKAEYYYNIVVTKDSTGYFFDYQSYAELYINYLPEDKAKVETIMLAGADKAFGPNKLEFYKYLYYFWQERNNKSKAEYYRDRVKEIDPQYQL